jgi:hypothetical protein
MKDDEFILTPDSFKAIPLTPEEQAKVDRFRSDWERDPAKAVNAFMVAEPFLCVRAMDYCVGPDAFTEALILQIQEQWGLSRADFRTNV